MSDPRGVRTEAWVTLEASRRTPSRSALLAVLLACTLPAGSVADAAAKPCLANPEARITIGNDYQPIPLRPGATGQLWLNCEICCWVPEPIDAELSWSFEPASAGRIDPKSGEFALAADIVPGSPVMAIVAFDVGGKTRRVEKKIVVIDPAPQPWAGIWRESARLACTAEGKAGGPDATPADKAPLIQEFTLNEDGTFDVTWHPYEHYKDFWGTYTFDRETGAVAFTVTGGNSLPPKEADLAGTMKLVPGEGLVLSDLYFAPRGVTPPKACGHKFGG